MAGWGSWAGKGAPKARPRKARGDGKQDGRRGGKRGRPQSGNGNGASNGNGNGSKRARRAPGANGKGKGKGKGGDWEAPPSLGGQQGPARDHAAARMRDAQHGGGRGHRQMRLRKVMAAAKAAKANAGADAELSEHPERRDAGLKGVVINERKNKKYDAYFKVGAEVPYPFTSREQYEASMRRPLGPEWNTVDGHNKRVQPSIQARAGTVIDPLRKTKAFEHEKEKLRAAARKKKEARAAARKKQQRGAEKTAAKERRHARVLKHTAALKAGTSFRQRVHKEKLQKAREVRQQRRKL